MLPELRLVQIREQFADLIDRIMPLVLEEETIQLVLYLRDGTNLRVTEKWRGESLERYSCYWLSAEDQLKSGWDNAPHHRMLEYFPHHKHIAEQSNRQPSQETTLDAVMHVILSELSSPP